MDAGDYLAGLSGLSVKPNTYFRGEKSEEHSQCRAQLFFLA
jgi:hypothetical protein